MSLSQNLPECKKARQHNENTQNNSGKYSTEAAEAARVAAGR